MLKHFFSIAFVLLLTASVTAQQSITRIPIGDIATGFDVLKIQALNINDSVLIASTDTKHKDKAKAYWVFPDGNTMKITNSEINGKIFVCLDRIADSTYFYYLEEQRNYIVLRALVQSNQTSVLVTCPKKLVFIGTFINLFRANDHHLYLISMVKEKNEIHVVEVKDHARVSEKVIALGIDLNTNDSPFMFVKASETLSPTMAASPNKIFQQGSFLYLDIDRIYKRFEIPRKTSFARIDLQTGALAEKEIIDVQKMRFHTYIERNRIFKISQKKDYGCIVNIYDIETQKIINTITIDKASTFANRSALKRKPINMYRNETVFDAVSKSNVGFITATTLDSAIVLKVGCSDVSEPTVYILPQFSVLALIVATVSIAAVSISDPKTVDQYFYLLWDGQNNFTFPDKPVSVDQLVDDYDISAFNQKIKFDYKGHVPLRNKVVGIYHAQGSSSLDIITFEIPK